jgi:murein DD-endopeptidase MepM/ murein hydrolase activator NlpD
MANNDKGNYMKKLRYIVPLVVISMTLFASAVFADAADVDFLVNNVEKYMTINIPGYGIFINDQPIGYLERKEDAQSILLQLKTMYLDEGTDSLEAEFKEDVSIRLSPVRIVDQAQIYSRAELFDIIVIGTNERKTHEIEKGENFWDLSIRYGIEVNDLLKANPDVVPERLQIGQEISLIVPKPRITVVTKERATYSENIQFNVVYEDSSTYYQGDYRTKRSGVYGELEIVADIYKENGIQSAKEILSETVLKEPVTKIVYRGTKDPPPRIGTGTFDYPYNTSRGHVTSDFGMRYHPIYKDYRRHTGVDIAMSSGSIIGSADGGKVVYSGYNGGYGLMIKIDHGANIETIYAHLSKSYVSVGDMVYKGEKIGLSGNTGVSTGPHLHFEVREIGVPVDPGKYLSGLK